MKCGFDSKPSNSLLRYFCRFSGARPTSPACSVRPSITVTRPPDHGLFGDRFFRVRENASTFVARKRSSNEPNFVVPDSDSLRVLQSRRIPGIAEAEDRRIGWHQVQYEVVIDSSAPRGAILDR